MVPVAAGEVDVPDQRCLPDVPGHLCTALSAVLQIYAVIYVYSNLLAP